MPPGPGLVGCDRPIAEVDPCVDTGSRCVADVTDKPARTGDTDPIGPADINPKEPTVARDIKPTNPDTTSTDDATPTVNKDDDRTTARRTNGKRGPG